MAEELLLDSSVAVALLVEDHIAHGSSLEAVRGFRLGMAGHALFETMSVLTRLPGADRRPVGIVETAIARSFPATRFLSEAGSLSLMTEIGEAGISGGAIFDALVAAAAREHGLVLATRDSRARSTYRALNVEVRFID